MRRHPLPRWLAMAVTAILITACATTVNVDYDKSYDFGAIRTIRLLAPAQPATGDTRINSALVATRIENATINLLQSRGYRVVETQADVDMRYRLDTRSGLDTYGGSVSFGYGHFGPHTGIGLGYGLPLYDVDSYDEGVLTIDVVDGRDQRLLWRGSSSRRLYDGMTPEKLDTLVYELVSETLANFPPGRITK